ncbi:unnamed protein product [Caenorhabditis nigoni]
MLSLAFYYCYGCRSNRGVNLFDCERRKPIFGSCGHTICLECVEKNVNRECPICETSKAFVNKTVNYTSLQIIEDSKNNYWEFMKKWWSGTGAGEGSCSRCPDKKPILRLCLTCDKNRCCQRRHGANRLRLGCDVDLLNLATQVVCTGCFYKYHDGHQMIRLDRVDYFKDDLKMATSEIILTLFRDWMKKKEITTKCKLRHIRIEMAGRHLWKALEKKTNSREGQCGWLMEQIKINFIKKGVANLDRQLEQLSMITEECECNRLYEKMVKTGYRSSGGMQYDFELFAIRCIKSEQLECPLYFEPNKSHYKMLIEKTGHMVSIKSKNSIPLTDYGGNCPLCVLFDHDETKCLEYYTINCIEIYENWWKSEMPALETLCFRCLNDLNHFKVRMSCKYRQNQRMKYGRKRGRFTDCDEDSDVEECDNPNCSLRNAEYWKFSIKDQTIGDASRIVRGGIKSIEGFLNCKLRRMRLMNIYDTISYRAHGFTVEYLSKWSKDEVAENCQRVTDSIEVLKSQWNEFRFGNGNETADEGSKCRCTHLWEQEKLVLDRVYDKIARYRLASFVEGCPLTFDHGINIEELLISNQIDRVVI